MDRSVCKRRKENKWREWDAIVASLSALELANPDEHNVFDGIVKMMSHHKVNKREMFGLPACLRHS